MRPSRSISVAAASTFLTCLLPAAAAPAGERIALDAERIRPGVARYRIVENGQEVGEEIVRTSVSDGVLTLHVVARMGDDTYEDAVLRVDAANANPLSDAVSARFGDTHGIAHYSFEDGRIQGSVSLHRESEASYRVEPVGRAAPEGLWLRGSTIFLVHALPLPVGASLELPWLSPLQARIEQVRLEVTGEAEIEVPFGRFTARRIEQQGGTPGNVFWVSTGEPRRLVRVEVVGRPMTIDLVSEQPLDAPEAPPPALQPGMDVVRFFLGEWDVESLTADGQSVIGRARTEVRPILDGRALQADYYGLDPTGATVFRGTTVRTRIPETERFAVHWSMAELPGYTYLHEEYRDGALHAQGHGVDARGEFLERYRYFDLSETTYSFEMSRSYDGGETWQPFARLRAKKRASD